LLQVQTMKNSDDEKNCNELIELKLLQDAIFMKYGYDFRNYRKSHFRRRIQHRMTLDGITSIAQIQHNVLYNVQFFSNLLKDLSINVTEMYRDPEFYVYLRNEILPRLKTYPFLKVWHAGCATGEEVYSMCILFKEEGLYEKTRFYATDFNQFVLHTAAEGIYPLEKVRMYTENYLKAGGKYPFSDYYHADSKLAIFDKSLTSNVVFSDHNLVTDGVFGEMNLIICRNVLIYFNQDLKNRVLRLFSDSLTQGGILCLGTKENVTDSNMTDTFETVERSLKIYKKAYGQK
jgi:chemotaxis protein methyltransferase CheR